MNSQQRKTLQAIFTRPTLRNIVFVDIESLLVSLGCIKTEGDGSRLRFDKGEEFFLCHRPHPGKEAKKYQVNDARDFLMRIGVKP